MINYKYINYFYITLHIDCRFHDYYQWLKIDGERKSFITIKIRVYAKILIVSKECKIFPLEKFRTIVLNQSNLKFTNERFNLLIIEGQCALNVYTIYIFIISLKVS